MITNKKIMMLATTDNMIWQFLMPHIKFLQDQGNTVECVCSKTGFWFDELRDKFGLTCHDVSLPRNPLHPSIFKGWKQLKKLQKQEHYDLVYCQQAVGGVLGRLIAKKYKIPCIYTAHGFSFCKGNSKLKNLVFKTIEKKLSKYTTALITMNDADYQEALKFKAKKVYKISGIGFDKNKYITETLTKSEARNLINLKDEFTILTCAEFIKRKNYDTMLRTIAELKYENIKFEVCGSGKDKELIEQQIKELEIEDKVDLLGYRKDINNMMTAADIFFLPSHQEGLTLSIIEAMNFGLPIVTSNVRGNQDLVEDGRNGFVCEQNDYKAFSKVIKSIMLDSNLAQQMSNRSKELAKKYSIENVRKELENIYEEIANEL